MKTITLKRFNTDLEFEVDDVFEYYYHGQLITCNVDFVSDNGKYAAITEITTNSIGKMKANRRYIASSTLWTYYTHRIPDLA